MFSRKVLFALNMGTIIGMVAIPILVQAESNKNVIVTNDVSESVPVSVQGKVGVTVGNDENNPVVVAPPVPVSLSGEWESAGMNITPPMILHDLIFYADDLNGQPSCSFTMNYVIDQFSSRRLRRFDIGLEESVEVHFEAGVDTRDLRFGTIGSGCTRHWAAFGFEVPTL